MMARSSKSPSIGRIQKRKTNLLQIIIFGLQGAAGPYRGATSRLMRCSENQRSAQFVALFDRLRCLPEPGEGVTIVPRAEAFGGAVQDVAQPIPGTVPIIDPHEG